MHDPTTDNPDAVDPPRSPASLALLAAAPSDPPEVSIRVASDAGRGLVGLVFSDRSEPVALTPDAARALALALRQNANDAERGTGRPRPLSGGRGRRRRGRW